MRTNLERPRASCGSQRTGAGRCSRCQSYCGRVKALQEARDVRGSLLGQVVKGARLIKLRGCEEAWAVRLTRAREAELRQLRDLRYLSATSSLISNLLSLAVPAVTFAGYTLLQRKLLTPAVAFTALAWIEQMRRSISTLPGVYGVVATLLPSAERLARALDPIGASAHFSAAGSVGDSVAG
mmetsp:Transcript_22240/g.55468  ORF Transcript_22240/g.55468 Transcript_22240/m.55468 type:complete len:182 (+) Transcript_22240:207-752(+)